MRSLYKPNHIIVGATLTCSLLVSAGLSANQESTAAALQPKSMATLSFEQGAGTFKQLKYFKFLAKPIVSSGEFVVNDHDVLWQTNTPVFSQVLLKQQGVYRRLVIDEPFELLAQDTSINRVLSAMLTGNVRRDDWEISNDSNNNNSCFVLVPLAAQLMQLFNKVVLCAEQHNDRKITLFDNQQNKTEIIMTLVKSQLSQQEVAGLELP